MTRCTPLVVAIAASLWADVAHGGEAITAEAAITFGPNNEHQLMGRSTKRLARPSRT